MDMKGASLSMLAGDVKVKPWGVTAWAGSLHFLSGYTRVTHHPGIGSGPEDSILPSTKYRVSGLASEPLVQNREHMFRSLHLQAVASVPCSVSSPP